MAQHPEIIILALCVVVLVLLAGFAYQVHTEGLEKALSDAINAANRWGRDVGVVAGPMLMEVLLDTFELWLPPQYLKWIDLVRGGKSRRDWLRDVLQRLFDRSNPTKEVLTIQGPPAATARRVAERMEIESR